MNRRQFLKAAATLPAILSIPIALPVTPSIAEADEPTLTVGPGPFFKPDSPLRSNLIEPGVTRVQMKLTGTVLSTSGRPLRNVLLDFWQANQNGSYDTVGFQLRGHQFTNSKGEYELVTIVPSGYSGRTRHIHVRIQSPNQSILTTQLFFPGDPNNQTDFLFREELVMRTDDSSSGKNATFDFVLDA
jgi:protocatechuate 3,4-dioxygenase beta subunit